MHNETDIHALSTEDLNRHIRFFFEKRRVLFDRGDQDRFHLGLDQTLQLTKFRKQDWLKTMEIRRTATTRTNESLSAQMKPLQFYFRTDQSTSQVAD